MINKKMKKQVLISVKNGRRYYSPRIISSNLMINKKMKKQKKFGLSIE